MSKLARSPNLMITSFCNQNCNFCFAKNEMSGSQNREMTLARYKTLLNKISNEGVETIKLLGGEPMIHSQIKQIIHLGLQKFKYIRIFSNGLFSQENEKFLEKYYPRVVFTFNLTTPSFLKNKITRLFLINRVKKIAQKTSVTIALTVDQNFDLENFVDKITPNLVRKVSYFRIGVANPMLGSTNTFSMDQFSLIGTKIITFIKKLSRINPKLSFGFDCGVTPCMFDEKQLTYQKNKKVEFRQKGCYILGMDISTDSKAFLCFSLSKLFKISLAKKNLSKIQAYLLFSRYLYWKNYSLPRCKKCPNWGFELGKCAGPCLTYRLDILKKKVSKIPTN